MQNQKKYYLQFITICIGALVLSYGLSQLQNRYFSTSHFWIPTLFFALATIGTNALLTKGDKQSKEFVFKTLAMSMARLLVCMIFVFIYSLVNKPEALAFTCHFMIQYVLFTIFEMSFLLKYIKHSD
jgi:heme A synthase